MGRIVTIRFNDEELVLLNKIMKALGITNRSRAIKSVMVLFDMVFLEGLSLTELLKDPNEILDIILQKAEALK